MGKIKVGIIGCGNFATFQHLPNCADSEKIILRACCDLSKQNLENIQQFNPEYITRDYKKLLSDSDIDLVILAVPHEHHKFMLEQAVSAGKHILCEKPMTMTMDDAYDVMKCVKQNGVKLCVDYNRRRLPLA